MYFNYNGRKFNVGDRVYWIDYHYGSTPSVTIGSGIIQSIDKSNTPTGRSRPWEYKILNESVKHTFRSRNSDHFSTNPREIIEQEIHSFFDSSILASIVEDARKNGRKYKPNKDFKESMMFMRDNIAQAHGLYNLLEEYSKSNH